MLRWRLATIFGFCTDRGVESGITDVSDLLPEFLLAVGPSHASQIANARSICFQTRFGSQVGTIWSIAS